MVDTSWMRWMNKAPTLQLATNYDPWAAWKAGQDPYAPQTQSTSVAGASPYAQPAAGEWTSGDTFGTRYSGPAAWDYAQQGPPPSTPSGIDPTYATGNYPQETTYTIPGDPNTFGQPNAAALAPVVAAGQAAQQAAQQAKTGTGQSGQEQVNNAPKVASAGTVTLKPPDQRTRRSDQTAQEAGYSPSDPSFRPDFTFQNGQLRLRWSTYQEGINSRILRTMAAGMKERGLGEEAAYQAAVNEALGYINNIGAPDDSFVILPYQVFQGAARAFGDAGYKRDALWGTYGKQFNTIDAANNGDSAYDPNYGLAVTPVYGRGAAAATPGAAPATGAPGGGGGTGGGNGAGGGGGIFPSEVEMELARQSPEYAVAAYRKARGGGQDKSAVGDFRENMMGQAVRAYLTMLGAGGPGGNPVGMANQGMGDIVGALASGSGVGGILRQQAQQMMGQDLAGFDDKQLLAMFGAAQGAGGFGLGPFAQYALDNSYGDMEHIAQQHALSGQTTSALANPAARQKFMADLARYLAVR